MVIRRTVAPLSLFPRSQTPKVLYLTAYHTDLTKVGGGQSKER